MTTVNIHNIEFTRPDMYPKQFAAIYDKRRYSIIEASTKSGKTAGCIVWLIEKALHGKEGWNYWWVSPVSAQAQDAFDRAVRATINEQRKVIYTKPQLIILMTGARIWFHSGEHPDSLFGRDVHAAVIDEASRLKEKSWEAIRSTLTKTRGPIRIIGNVKGKKNWFYDLARRAEQQQSKPGSTMGYHKMIAADAVAAGVLTAEEIEDAKQVMLPAAFKELFLAEPADDEGNPFGDAQIRKCIAPMSKNAPVVWGWDLGKSTDFTVGIGLDRNGCVAKFVRMQGDWEKIFNVIMAETQMLPALIDSTGVGDPILERLQRHSSTIEGFKFTSISKQRLMEGLAAAIHKAEIRFPPDSPDIPIVFELQRFSYEYTATGVRYCAGEGFHDDCVCALALAVTHLAKFSLGVGDYSWVGGPANEQEAQEAYEKGWRPPPELDDVPRKRYVPGHGWISGIV